jgi:hypothetical protein
MAEVELSDSLDLAYATLWDIRRKKPPLATYAYPNYDFYNMFFKGNVKTVGKALEGHITLDKEDNAEHGGIWDADSLVKKNINKRYRMPWAYAKGGMLWNLIEQSINMSPARIYDVWEQQYDSCVKDLVEEVLSAVINGLTGSSDTDRPIAVTQWISPGTTGSTGGFTGYSGAYNDGGSTMVGGAFDKAGVSSDSSTNSDWANYFADHAGNIDDSLLSLMDTAIRKLNFRPPIIPEKLPVDRTKFALYTSNNVLEKLNTFYRNSDDNMGYRPDGYFGTPSINRMPLVYCPPFDTANTDVYGTDPILGLNHDYIYPVILKGWDFKITKCKDSNRHNVMALYMDLVYQIWCNTSPKYAGFLVSDTATTPS